MTAEKADKDKEAQPAKAVKAKKPATKKVAKPAVKAVKSTKSAKATKTAKAAKTAKATKTAKAATKAAKPSTKAAKKKPATKSGKAAKKRGAARKAAKPSRSPAAAKQYLRIRLRGYDHRQLDQATDIFVDMIRHLGDSVRGPIPLPTTLTRFDLLRSPHKDKDSREQIEIRTYHRLLVIPNPSAKTVQTLDNQLQIPEGVSLNMDLR